jgi:hypothetical protein
VFWNTLTPSFAIAFLTTSYSFCTLLECLQFSLDVTNTLYFVEFAFSDGICSCVLCFSMQLWQYFVFELALFLPGFCSTLVRNRELSVANILGVCNHD